MKKSITSFGLVICFFFMNLLLYGQSDTLIYKTGEKAAVKIDSIGVNEIFYKAPTGMEQYKISKSQIDYIKTTRYGIYPINLPETVKRKDSINGSFVSVYLGVGLPIANTNSNDYSRGNIVNFSTCKNYSVLAEYAIPHSHFGLAAEFNYNYNAFDFNNFLLSNNYLLNFTLQNENAPYFKIYSLLGGGFFGITTDWCRFTTRLLAGCSSFQSPYIEFGGYTSLDSPSSFSSSITQESYSFQANNSLIFLLDVGISFNFKIIKRIYGFFSADYVIDEGWVNTNEITASPYTSTTTGYGSPFGTTTTTIYNSSTQTSQYNYRVPVNMFDFSTGISYLLSK